MSEKYKTYPGKTYFITITVQGWIDLFTRQKYAEFIENNINFCIENKGLEVYEYVVMPSHIHLIARTEYNISEWLRDFKGFTSRKLYETIKDDLEESRREWLIYLFNYFSSLNNGNKIHKLWKNGNHPEEVFSKTFYEQKVDYILNNPVKDGIVTSPEYYRYSSANPQCKINIVRDYKLF